MPIQSISEAIRLLSRYPKRLQSTTPRTSSRYIRLLKFIRNKEGALASHLAVMMDIKPGSLSEMLAYLEEDLLIERVRDPQDKRKHRFYLTKKGYDHLYTYKHNQYDIFKDVLSPQEKADFIRLSHKLIQGLEDS